MTDQHLVEYLTRMDCRGHSVPMIAARRLKESVDRYAKKLKELKNARA